jgi:hypothetical protein
VHHSDLAAVVAAWPGSSPEAIAQILAIVAVGGPAAALKAIRDAGEGGGFILSTGDQCGRDTPEASLYEIVQTAREFGTYPLDLGRTQAEIGRLEA